MGQSYCIIECCHERTFDFKDHDFQVRACGWLGSFRFGHLVVKPLFTAFAKLPPDSSSIIYQLLNLVAMKEPVNQWGPVCVKDLCWGQNTCARLHKAKNVRSNIDQGPSSFGHEPKSKCANMLIYLRVMAGTYNRLYDYIYRAQQKDLDRSWRETN